MLNLRYSFRPRTGDYFFIGEKHVILEQRGSICFRPRTGDYFFIMALIGLTKEQNEQLEFPSTYWGLFFYR